MLSGLLSLSCFLSADCGLNLGLLSAFCFHCEKELVLSSDVLDESETLLSRKGAAAVCGHVLSPDMCSLATIKDPFPQKLSP